jgi:hypothetical protein
MYVEDDISTLYTYLQSQQTAQNYLYKRYKKIKTVDAERKSYENCNVFLYCLEHGLKYYNAGKELDPLIQPVMFFYGMTHLLKALILTKRPEYPESTTVLAHGVSARKRKKKNYSFLEDEVKIQHNGLFPYFSEHLFQMKQIPFEKISMISLLSLIPELTKYFQLKETVNLVKIGTTGTNQLEIPKTICDAYHLTENAFITKVSKYLPGITHTNLTKDTIILKLEEPITRRTGPFQIDMANSIYLPADRNLFFPISEVMVHYLILYNLSMLSRYEAEWWGELLTTKPDIDFPFITGFLAITQQKIPYIIGSLLMEE